MTLRQQAVRGVAWSSAQNWGSALISTIVLLILARLLEPEAFGLLALATSLTLLLEVLLRRGFGQLLIQCADPTDELVDSAFWLSAASGVLLFAVALGVAGPVATLFSDPRLGPIIRWLALGLLTTALINTPQSLLERRLAFKGLAACSLLGAVGGGFVGIGMALNGCGLWSLVGNNLTAGLVRAAALWWISSWRPSARVSRARLRELLSFGLNIIGVDVLNVLSRRFDALMIGYFLGTTQLGYYDIAKRVLLALTQVLTQSVSSVAFPTFSRLQASAGQMRSACGTAARLTAAGAFPAFFGMVALSPEFVAALLDQRWTPAVPLIRILAFLGVIQVVIYFNGILLVASGRPGWHLAIKLVNTLADVVAVTVAVQWGIGAVAAAVVIRAFLLFPLPIWATHKLMGVIPLAYLTQFAAPLAASVAMLAALAATKHLLAGFMDAPALLGVGVAVGACIYAVSIRILAPPLAREILALARIVLPSGNEKSP